MADEPKLLSGKNPRIAKGDGEAPVRAWLDAAPGWKGGTCCAMDAVVGEIVSDIAKADKWNTPLYEARTDRWFRGHHCMTSCARVTWFDGDALRYRPPVASKQPNVRYSDLAKLDAQFVEWIRQAATLPGQKL
jgi:hypothetical protein